MLKKALTAYILPFLFLLNPPDAISAAPLGQTQKSRENQSDTTGTLQKMIVENGTVTMELDLNRLNGITFMAPNFEAWRFDVAGNSFFSILVFNDLLRGPEEDRWRLSRKALHRPEPITCRRR